MNFPTPLSDEIARYLVADSRAREVSIVHRIEDGNYEVTLTDLNRDKDAETPRGSGATLDQAMERALDAHDREEERAHERRATTRRLEVQP